MIINSSNVGMESARTYRSTTTRTLSFSAKTTLYSLADNALGNQDLLGRGSEESLEANEESAAGKSETTNSANEAMERMQGSKGTGVDRIHQIEMGEEKSAIERIRERCILHLWELFFGKKRHFQC